MFKPVSKSLTFFKNLLRFAYLVSLNAAFFLWGIYFFILFRYMKVSEQIFMKKKIYVLKSLPLSAV